MKLIDNIKNAIGEKLAATVVKSSSWAKLFSIAQENAILEGSTVTKPYTQELQVYKAIKAICDNVPQADLGIYNVKTDEREWNDPQAKELQALLDRPNPLQSKSDFVQAVAGYYTLFGEFFVVKSLAEDKRDVTLGQAAGTKLPSCLWAFNPSGFSEVVKDQKFLGWKYNGKTEYQPHEVIHSADFNPDSILRGVKPTDPMRKHIEIMFQSMVYNKAFFDNFARLGTVFTTDGNLSDVQYKRIQSYIEKQHKGASKAFKSAIFEGGLKPTELGATHKDMDFIEQVRYGREEILGTFRVPKALFSITEDLNYATFMGQMKIFWQYGLMPILRKVEESINNSLVKPYAPHLYCKFDLSQVPAFQADLSTMATTAQAFFAMGVPFNEINERLGLGFEPSAHGAIGYLPFNLAPAGEAQAAPTPEQDSNSDDDEKLIEHIETKAQPVDKAHRSEMIWKAYLKGHTPVEAQMQRALKNFFYEQRNRVLSSITEKSINRDGIISKEIVIGMNWDDETEKIKKVAKPHIKEGAEQGAMWGEAQIGMKVDAALLQSRISSLVATRADNVANVQRTVTGLVDGIMTGLQGGETIEDIKTRIKNVYTQAGNRAKTIARTETGCAINSGAYQYYKEVEAEENVYVVKEWITAGDENVRDSHIMVDGETAMLDKSFSNGLQYPNDPDGDAADIINCRCAYITTTELKG